MDVVVRDADVAPVLGRLVVAGDVVRGVPLEDGDVKPRLVELPDLGEGTVAAEIVSWRVKPGDVVAEDDVLVEVMTEKAAVEVPAPVDGRVVSTEELLERVWDSEADPFTTAVKTTIRRLRLKLGSPPVIHTFREGGYRIGDQA